MFSNLIHYNENKIKTPLPTVLFYRPYVRSNRPDNPELKNDIGFNTNFIVGQLFQSTATPFTFLYKRYTAPTKAIRLGFDARYQNQKNEGQNNAPNNYYNNVNDAYFSLTIGREWQRLISKRWTFYGALDLAPSLSSYKTDNFIGDSNTGSQTRKEYRVSVRPTVGIRFNILDQLYISAEANAGLGYSSYSNKSTSTNPDQVLQDYKGTGTYFNFVPATGIYLFYRF
jgi:hypothetical protein